ncbi:MAG: hypothetical protein M3261_04170 [Thermoproteota archaeon]|nr:hypothetical protein [Thermoproteota archaeon]
MKKNKEKKTQERQQQPSWLTVLLINVQRKCAAYLNKRTAHWSQRRIKVVFGILCFLFTAASTGIIFSAVKSSGKRAMIPKVQAIPFPKQLEESNPNSSDKHTYTIEEKEYQKLQQLFTYMDSLAVRDSKKRDSILGKRPGLMDSALTLQKLYEAQGKRETNK